MDATIAGLVLGGGGAIFGLLGALLAFSLSRNVNALDESKRELSARVVTLAADLANARLDLADCVRRTALDEVNSRMASMDVKLERLLILSSDRSKVRTK